MNPSHVVQIISPTPTPSSGVEGVQTTDQYIPIEAAVHEQGDQNISNPLEDQNTSTRLEIYEGDAREDSKKALETPLEPPTCFTERGRPYCFMKRGPGMHKQKLYPSATMSPCNGCLLHTSRSWQRSTSIKLLRVSLKHSRILGGRRQWTRKWTH